VSRLVRRSVVDFRGPGNSPEKRTLHGRRAPYQCRGQQRLPHSSKADAAVGPRLIRLVVADLEAARLPSLPHRRIDLGMSNSVVRRPPGEVRAGTACRRRLPTGPAVTALGYLA